MWSPVVRLRADEHQAGRRGVRVKLWQETEFPKIDGAEREGPRTGGVRQGRGHRLGSGSEISSSDVYVFVQSHGVWKLHGLLSGSYLLLFKLLRYLFITEFVSMMHCRAYITYP